MKIDIMTLFPEMIDGYMNQSIMKKAHEKGLIDVKATNIRDFAFNKHKRADDSPYGGSRGMVMLAEPLYQCHKHLTSDKKIHTILMSPTGKPFTQSKAIELLEKEHIILVCGHYEGIDQRFIDLCVDEEISIGDFVLTGGELPALCVSDAICRMAEGVLPHEDCFQDESHFGGLLEHAHYTRPEVWQDMSVPSVLLSGHHANIVKWRHEQSVERTKERRPDMYEKYLSENKKSK